MSETEGKLKQVEDEKNRVTQSKYDLEDKCENLQKEVTKYQQSNESIRLEMEHLKK